MSMEAALDMLTGSDSEAPLVFEGDSSLTAGGDALERGNDTCAATVGDAAWSRARRGER